MLAVEFRISTNCIHNSWWKFTKPLHQKSMFSNNSNLPREQPRKANNLHSLRQVLIWPNSPSKLCSSRNPKTHRAIVLQIITRVVHEEQPTIMSVSFKLTMRRKSLKTWFLQINHQSAIYKKPSSIHYLLKIEEILMTQTAWLKKTMTCDYKLVFYLTRWNLWR